MSKAERERSARQRLAEERLKQAARQKQQRMLMIVLGVVAVVAVAVVVIVTVSNSGDDKKAPKYAGPLAPTSRQADGSIVMAKAGVAKPVLEVFEDFQCPACKALEDTTGKTIKEQAAAGAVKVVYRPFRLFQQEPLKSNSQRAANAAECAPADKWVPFHDQLYANQPEEGSDGFANKDLIKWAGEVGITGDAFTQCVNGGQKNASVDQATAYAQKAGVTGTPTLMLDGKKVGDDALTPDGLKKAISAAGK
ncbi:thioredoxin domain-containing protein [Actinomadura barringtoniae]|uniref:Thioredoxin domain-containing protein n=1 Tax=Actinomadura barringtoniae TaxID=1427535 RepID=A0A939PBI8_9ACTN|nr:thioredoxin domain-containing protein [Actinomadura barringtoniae]MBO2449772.1 thioredoxin domain-containing protein [Actinomadura barringtoniae]